MRVVAVSRRDYVKMPRKVFKEKFFVCVEQPRKANKGLCGWGVLCQSRIPAILELGVCPKGYF